MREHLITHRRKLALISAATAALLMAAACSSSNGTGASSSKSAGSSSSSSGANAAAHVTINFPNFQNVEQPYATWWKQFLAAYQAKYPNVTVNVSSVSNSSALQDLVTTEFAAGNPPDVLQAATGSFAAFANAGYLMPLDDVLKGTRVPTNWGKLQSSFVWDGKTLGVMSLSSALVLHYNKKLLDAAHVSVPTTPDELVKAAQAVYDPKKGIYGFAGATAGTDTTMQNQAGAFVYGMGGAWFKDCTATFTDAATETAVAAYASVMKTSPKGMQGNQALTAFEAGKAAFYIDKPSKAASIVAAAPASMKNDFGVTKLPFQNSAGNANVYLAIPKGISGDKLTAAENFIKLAVSPEWQAKYAEDISAPAPDPQATKSLEKTDPQMGLFSQLTAQAVNILPTCPAVAIKYPVLQKIIYNTLTQIATTSTPVNSALQKLQSDVAAQLG